MFLTLYYFEVLVDRGDTLLAEALTFSNQLHKVWKPWCSHSAKSWKIFLFFPLLLQCTIQAAVAVFQGPAHTAAQPVWHLFVANIIVVYLPSVILALSFQSLLIVLKRIRPNLMMEH